MSLNQHVRGVGEGRRAGQRDAQSINVTINQSHEHRRHYSVAASSLAHRPVYLLPPKQGLPLLLRSTPPLQVSRLRF